MFSNDATIIESILHKIYVFLSTKKEYFFSISITPKYPAKFSFGKTEKSGREIHNYRNDV